MYIKHRTNEFMKTDTILIGTKDELLEYFFSKPLHNKPPKDTLLSPTNTLGSWAGFEYQLSEIENNRKGIGLVFYMEFFEVTDGINPEFPEVNLVLKSQYVAIKNWLKSDGTTYALSIT